MSEKSVIKEVASLARALLEREWSCSLRQSLGRWEADNMVAKSDNAASPTVARKAYQKPSLNKAAVLAAIAADTQVSGAPG